MNKVILALNVDMRTFIMTTTSPFSVCMCVCGGGAGGGVVLILCILFDCHGCPR